MNDGESSGPDPTELPATETARSGGPAGRGAGALPESIGKYRILSKLGEGGMGVVYEAEQDSPRRKVAVKVVRGGQFVDERRVRMFQREAETLARLKHPNIAAIYESGRTDDGQHFFAMELVRGNTLDRYMKTRPEVSTRAELNHRLRLFRKIGDAVHYAHQRAVIHRDLKPSNIIVTEEATAAESTPSGPPLPGIKILDFGLARITEGDLAAPTLSAEVGAIKGTLAYMSPEQARGRPEDIDVRTDVYALGVILYEMLTGTRPYDVMEKALAEAVRVICEERPPALSRTLGGMRRIDPDIETIVGRALEKEAERRYPSAVALSEDVGRYLLSQPILARPPSATYQLKKLVQRNKLPAALLALLALAVLGFGIGMSVLFARAVRAEARSRKEAQTATRTLDFMTGMFELSDPAESRGAEITVREILDKAAAQIEEELQDQPEVQTRLLLEMGNVYALLGLYPQAEPLILQATEIRKKVLGEQHPETLDALVSLANLYRSEGRFEESESLCVDTLEKLQRVQGREHRETLVLRNVLAALYQRQSRFEEAESLFRETLEIQERALGEAHADTNQSRNNLALVYRTQGRYAESAPLYLKNIEILQRLVGEDHPDTLLAQTNLAELYRAQGRPAEAESLYLETLETMKRVQGEEHPKTLLVMHNLADLYRTQGRFDEAESLIVETFETRKRVLGEDHPDTLLSKSARAIMYLVRARYAEGEKLLLETLEAQKRVLGEDHPNTGISREVLALFYTSTFRFDEARPFARELLAARKRNAEAQQANPAAKNAYARYLLTCVPIDLRDPEAALPFALEAGRLTSFREPTILDTLALAYYETGDTARAFETQKKAIALLPEGDNPRRAAFDKALAKYEAVLAR